MTKTDLFRILIKTMGLFCAIEGLFLLIPTFRYVNGFLSFSMVIHFIYFLVLLLIVYVLLFQTERIIRLLRLEKGFDSQHIDLAGLDTRKTMYVALLIIGGLLLVNNLPTFLYECYEAFKNQISAPALEIDSGLLHQTEDKYKPLLVSGLGCLFGFLIVTNLNRLATWVERNP